MKKHIVKIFLAIFVVLVFLISHFSLLISTVVAATNIDSVYRYAWNDVVGWIDFYSTGRVGVYSDRLEGYAASSVGYIALNCNSTPNGNICGASNFKVSNDGNGNLSGWAYSDAIGWISFDSATAGSSYFYQVTINPTTGDFSGWAWNDIVGWISFNCADAGACGSSNYKVKTSSWASGSQSSNLISSIFDTGVSGGAAINTIMWQGDQPSGASVSFQIASSATSTGPWDYKGPDGSDKSVYLANFNNPVKINPSHHNNKRYFRYKIFLESDYGGTQTPVVRDVIINWSP